MIQHVAREITTADLQSCVDFYGVLGFAPVPVPDGIAGRAAWLERAGTQVHLLFVPGPVRHSGHVAVVVEDYEATVESLRAAGHEVQPRREHWGSPRAYVHDPAGHLVEIMAFAPRTVINK